MASAETGTRNRIISTLLIITFLSAYIGPSGAAPLPGRVFTGIVYDMDTIPVANSMVTITTSKSDGASLIGSGITNETGHYHILLFNTVAGRPASFKAAYGGKTGYNNTTVASMFTHFTDIHIPNLDTTPPSGVENFTAEAVQGVVNITLDWSPATDNVGVTNYILMRSADNISWSSIATLPHTSLEYTDSSGSPDTLYRYRIGARDGDGNVGPWSFVSVYTDDVLPPRISHVAVVEWDEDVDLTLEAVVVDSSPVSVFLWYDVGFGGVNVSMDFDGVWSFVVSGDLLLPGSLWYRIDANDGQKWSSTGLQETIIKDTTPPSGVPNFTAVAVQGTLDIVLSWEHASDNVGVAGYVIKRSLDNLTGEEIAFIQYSTSVYIDGEGDPETTYYYNITPRDAAGNLGPSSYTNETTDDVDPPRINHTSTPFWDQDTDFMIWAEITDSSPVTAYLLYNISGAAKNVSMYQQGDLWNYTVPGDEMVPGALLYRIRATDGMFWRTTREYGVSVLDTVPPSAVSNLSVMAVQGVVDVVLSWQHASDNVGVVGYTLERSVDNVTWVGLASLGFVSSYTSLSGLPDTLYYYRIKARDGDGNVGPWSFVSVYTDDVLPPRIIHTPVVVWDECVDLILEAVVVDSSPVSVYLWYDNGVMEKTIAMQHKDSIWRATIPATNVLLGSISYSITATDGMFWRTIGAHEVIINDATPPTTVENFAAQPIMGTLHINTSWSLATDNVGVDRYNLERSQDYRTWITVAHLGAETTEYVDTVDMAQTRYYYRIRAEDAQNNSGQWAYTQVVSVSIDLEPPRIIHQSPDDPPKWESIPLSAMITDPNGVKNAILTLETEGGQRATLNMTLHGGMWRTVIPWSMADGFRISYTITAWDSLNNSATSQTYQIRTIPRAVDVELPKRMSTHNIPGGQTTVTFHTRHTRTAEWDVDFNVTGARLLEIFVDGQLFTGGLIHKGNHNLTLYIEFDEGANQTLQGSVRLIQSDMDNSFLTQLSFSGMDNTDVSPMEMAIQSAPPTIFFILLLILIITLGARRRRREK